MIDIDIQILVQALELNPLGTIIVNAQDPQQPIVYVNPAFETLTGFDSGELIGRAWRVLAAGSKDEANWPDAEQSPELSAARTTAKLRCRGQLAMSETVEIDLAPLYDQPGKPAYWLGTEQRTVTRDPNETGSHSESLLSVIRDARMHLRKLDGRDAATGILTRRAFENLLQRDWVMARREQRELGIVIFRVDAFQEYRDIFGRHAADSCLRKVAHAITGSLRRAGDLTARFSDDCFVVLIGSANVDQAVALAERVASKVRSLAIHHPRSAVARFVTVSYGSFAEVPAWSESCARLIQRAESELTSSSATDGAATLSSA